MSKPVERPGRRERLRTSLWTLSVPPTIWAAHFLFCYLFAAIRCAKAPADGLAGLGWWIGGATLLSLALILWAGIVAWHQQSGGSDAPPHKESTKEDRTRFIAFSTLLLAGLSSVAVVFTALPAFAFTTCQ